MLLDTTHGRGLDTEPRDDYRALGRSFPNMDRVAPAATSRDYHNPVPASSSAQSAPYRHDAGDYQRQPHHPYGSHSNHGSSHSNGRREYANTAESRPVTYESDGYQSNKKQRTGHDQNGQQRPQYEPSYAPSHQHHHHAHPAHGPSSSAGPASSRPMAQRPLAPRPLDNSTSLPRFSVPIMHSPPKASHQAPSNASYPSRSEMQNSSFPSFPSPPLVSPLNGSPYPCRESTLSGGVPAAPSPGSSHGSSRDEGRPSQYSVPSQNPATHYFSSGHGPPPSGLPPRGGPPSAYSRGPSPPPHQQYPPMQGSHAADGCRDPQYPYHNVPYSGGPMQFQFAQPYNTLSQQWAPTLPTDFEEREAYCDSAGVIRKREVADRSRHPHNQHGGYQGHQGHSVQQPNYGPHEHPQQPNYGPHEHPQQPHYECPAPAPSYGQYEQHYDRDYKQQIDRHDQQHQEDMMREQQHDQPQRPQEPQRYDDQRRHYEHQQQSYERYDSGLHHRGYQGHHEQRPEHRYEHQCPGCQHQQHHQHAPQYHDHPHQHGQPPDAHYDHRHQHPQHAGEMEVDDTYPGWEPEPKPKDIENEESKKRKAEEEAQAEAQAQAATQRQRSNPASAQSSPPTSRTASLHDILHPVDTTPVLTAAQIPVRPASETHTASVPAPIPTIPTPVVLPVQDPPVVLVPAQVEDVTDDYSEENGSPETSSPRGGKTERRQRGVFTQEQRDETSQTRTYGACLRCKSQRVRCVPSPLGPYDMCLTCEQVTRNSKKVLHSIRCVRWRLTSMTTYRSGGLELTKRWEGTEVHNVGDWVNDDVKEIDLKLYYSSHMHRYDLCDTPVKLKIREFAPLPDDVVTRKWSKRVVAEDGTPTIERKVATLPAFALADVDEATKSLDSYFKTNTIKAMYDATRHSVPIIREHYIAAIRHYESFPDGDFEKTFLEKFFRLWFYTRFTTGSSYISGGDKLGCKPINDPDYPMGNRISVPRMITAQCDSIMVTKFLKPLSHDLILELEKIFRTGNPDNWFTLYICTFMLLGEVSFSSQDRRRHGTDNWITETPYSLYEFVSDLQFGGNILLCYWHYYRTMDPMDSGWDIFCQVIEPPLAAREKIESAKGKGKKKVHVTQDQRQLVMSHWPKMVELADILSTVHHNKSFEHPLYFVSQMYMREWEIREVYTYTPPGCMPNRRLNVTQMKR